MFTNYRALSAFLLAVCLWWVVPAGAGIAAAEEKPADKPADKPARKAPELIAGKSTRIEMDKLRNHIIVHLPPDYVPDRKWPIIFCYHGMGGKPTISPFNRLTGGRNFIIIGMPYAQQSVNVPKGRITSSEFERQMTIETKALTDVVVPFVNKHLSVDKRLCFIGGFSRGGWVSSTIGENVASACAGVIILGAGRERREKPLVNARWFRKKPVFVGVGENETNRPSGENAAKFYARHGAGVTLEIFKGLGHRVDTKSEKLRNWLLNNGPLKCLGTDLATARKLEKAGELGRAYAIYHAASRVSDTHKMCREAKKAADGIAGKAAADLAGARKLAAEKRYVEAARRFVKLAKTYGGSSLGRGAKSELEKLKSDTTVQTAIEQGELDAKAAELEAQAKAAEAEKDYANALRLYERYVAAFAKAGRFQQVKAHLDALKADKSIMGRVNQQGADRHCGGWLKMADNYINAGLDKKAKPYLQKIIKNYPDTDWATKARRRLAKMGQAGGSSAQ